MTKSEMQAEALDRARNGMSWSNYPTIIAGFLAKGIAEADIKPRDNVLTFNAWKAVGRSVKKGEHGVRVVTFIDCVATERDPASSEEKAVSYRRPHTTTVFHISQTEPTSEREKRHAGSARQWHRGAYGRARNTAGEYVVPDPGEVAADGWNETHS